MRRRLGAKAVAVALCVGLAALLGPAPAAVAGGGTPNPARGHDPGLDRRAAFDEALRLLAGEGLTGRRLIKELLDRQGRFPAEQNVFMSSTIALNDLRDPEQATAVVPLYRGVGPDGRSDEQYIITEASDFRVAQLLGVNYAPKLVWARGSGGDQRVGLDRRGRMRFRGAVDFAPVRSFTPGTMETVVPGTRVFPPASVQPGAVADDAWSSAVVLPSGLVLNAQIVANSSGVHDRVTAIEIRQRRVTMELLDGFQGGDQLYYHFVTDSSDAVAATLEAGVYAPRLAKLPRFGASTLRDRSALLGFSPNINGREGRRDPQRQGLNYTVASGGQDPINIFPLDPDNTRRRGNNYSPMWDAHVNQWTRASVDAGLRRQITGFADLRRLVAAGRVESGAISPPGPGNAYVAGLRPSNIIINCPVIAQPFETRENEEDDDPTT